MRSCGCQGFSHTKPFLSALCYSVDESLPSAAVSFAAGRLLLRDVQTKVAPSTPAHRVGICPTQDELDPRVAGTAQPSPKKDPEHALLSMAEAWTLRAADHAQNLGKLGRGPPAK